MSTAADAATTLDRRIDEAAARAESKVIAIRLHPATLAQAPDEKRRAEWEHAARDALVEEDLAPDLDGGPYVMELRFEGHTASVALLGLEEARAAAYRWDLRPLKELLGEYLTLGRRIESLRGEGPPAQWEAVDIAKRGVHDEAAGLIVEDLRPLGLGLESARRFFTLLTLIRLVQSADGSFSR